MASPQVARAAGRQPGGSVRLAPIDWVPGRTTGAHVAGDVATTGTAAADVTQSVPEQGESSVPGQDAEVAREATAPRRGRSRSAPADGLAST